MKYLDSNLNLCRRNLNLLPSLKALLDTQSVSQAARQMHVTQSAMSRTLAQLREALNDPILVRQGNRVFLSEKALTLKNDVNRVVAEASTLFENQQFDPGTSDKHLTIASNYIVLEQVLPQILRQFWQQAPNISFDLLPFSLQLDKRLEAGEVDLVLGSVGTPPVGFSYEPLMEDRICALVPVDHPLADDGDSALTVADLERYSVIRHSSWMGSPHFIRDYLEGLSEHIRMVARAPNLPIALQLLKDTQHILITTEQAAKANIYVDNMQIKALPDSPPSVTYYALWPEYWEYNRAHRWFREFIINRLRQHLKEMARQQAIDKEESVLVRKAG